jgi:hypothetical protein
MFTCRRTQEDVPIRLKSEWAMLSFAVMILHERLVRTTRVIYQQVDGKTQRTLFAWSGSSLRQHNSLIIEAGHSMLCSAGHGIFCDPGMNIFKALWFPSAFDIPGRQQQDKRFQESG